jgi:hypothetical protein
MGGTPAYLRFAIIRAIRGLFSFLRPKEATLFQLWPASHLIGAGTGIHLRRKRTGTGIDLRRGVKHNRYGEGDRHMEKGTGIDLRRGVKQTGQVNVQGSAAIPKQRRAALVWHILLVDRGKRRELGQPGSG